jgi:hypothetical protein
MRLPPLPRAADAADSAAALEQVPA